MKLISTQHEAGRATPCAPFGPAPEAARPADRTSAFTLVEIALSIAIIGFALVAIIGVLPAGLNVQKENREETIVVHDANFFLDAIRSGARGLNDLTNYVESITNVTTHYDARTNVVGSPTVFAYTDKGTWVNSALGNPADVLTNGANIIGLLSTPKYIYPQPLPPGPSGFDSNYVFAFVRALSGPAVEKAPQTNALVTDLAFRYRLISEIIPFRNWNTNWVDYTVPGLTPEEITARSTRWQIARNLQNNLHEVRLIFRWPIDSRRVSGNQRQVFRTLVGGVMTNEPPRWFIQSRNYQSPL